MDKIFKIFFLLASLYIVWQLGRFYGKNEVRSNINIEQIQTLELERKN